VCSSDLTPSEGESTPSEGESTPSEGESTPSEGESTHSEGESTPSEGESTPRYKKNMFYKHRPSEAWYSSYGHLNIKVDAGSVHLELQRKT
jgi:hypothetical protein